MASRSKNPKRFLPLAPFSKGLTQRLLLCKIYVAACRLQGAFIPLYLCNASWLLPKMSMHVTAECLCRDVSSQEADASPPPGLPKQFLLHPEGVESSHCSYAIFLLNKVKFSDLVKTNTWCLPVAARYSTAFHYCHNCLSLRLQDIEQLLESHGLTSAGPSLVLQNLYKLLTAALSAVVPRQQKV